MYSLCTFDYVITEAIYFINLIVAIKFSLNKPAPLYFVRSGDVELPITTGTFRFAGVGGIYWSSRASSAGANGTTTPSAYNINFNATGVYPSNGPYERWLGFPLRCLSTVLDM